MCCFKLDVDLCFCCWCAQTMYFICLVLDRCCLMSLVRSISRGYLGNYLNVFCGRGRLVTKTGMCCSIYSGSRATLTLSVREGTLALCSSPLDRFLFQFLFCLPLPLSSDFISPFTVPGALLCECDYYCTEEKHFSTMFFQTLNVCREDLQSSVFKVWRSGFNAGEYVPYWWRMSSALCRHGL